MPQVSPSTSLHWNRITQPYSRFGTRRLDFYAISVFGYNLDAEPWDEASGEDHHNYTEDEYTHPNWSILTPIIKGVGDVAELYYVSYWHVDEPDPDYFVSTIAVAVAAENLVDGMDSNFDPARNRSIKDAILNQMAENYSYDHLNVARLYLHGTGVAVFGYNAITRGVVNSNAVSLTDHLASVRASLPKKP